MEQLMNIGFGNVVNTSKVVSIISADSSPARRMIQTAKDQSVLIDATQGRRTKSLILTDSRYIISSALSPETLMIRFNGGPEQKGESCE